MVNGKQARKREGMWGKREGKWVGMMRMEVGRKCSIMGTHSQCLG